jgi:Na+/H+ antiporter NhaC
MLRAEIGCIGDSISNCFKTTEIIEKIAESHVFRV